MKDWPNSFWALCFIVLAVMLAVVALFRPNIDNVTMAVIAIASNIVSGSFGYISGHAAGANSVQVPLDQAAPSKTTVSVEQPKQGA